MFLLGTLMRPDEGLFLHFGLLSLKIYLFIFKIKFKPCSYSAGVANTFESAQRRIFINVAGRNDI